MDDIEETVTWQLENPKTPVTLGNCPNCKRSPWHGIPLGGCWGSHLPSEQAKRTIVLPDTPVHYTNTPNFRGI